MTHPTDFDHGSPLHAEFTDVLPVAALAGAGDGRPSAEAPHASQAVRQLPAGPGGVSLFLLGMGCLGAVKIGRSSRGLHLHSLPDWFHTGGPMQIGHVSVIDLDARAPLPAHYDQTPSDNSAHLSFRYVPRLLPRLEAQHFLTAVDTRGPPLFSF